MSDDIELIFENMDEPFVEALKKFWEEHLQDNNINDYSEYIVDGKLNMDALMAGKQEFRNAFEFFQSKEQSLAELGDLGPPEFDEDMFSDGESISLEEDDSLLDNSDIVTGDIDDLYDNADINENPVTSMDEIKESLKDLPPKEINDVDVDALAEAVMAKLKMSGVKPDSEQPVQNVLQMPQSRIGATWDKAKAVFSKKDEQYQSDIHEANSSFVNSADNNHEKVIPNNIVNIDEYRKSAQNQTQDDVSKKVDALKAAQMQSAMDNMKSTVQSADQSLEINNKIISGTAVAGYLSEYTKGSDLSKAMVKDRLATIETELIDEGNHLYNAIGLMEEGVDDLYERALSLGWTEEAIKSRILDPMDDWFEENHNDLDNIHKALDIIDDKSDPEETRRLAELAEKLREKIAALIEKIKSMFSRDNQQAPTENGHSR
jgi:hypothetical protein